jgi:hypothetical protein
MVEEKDIKERIESDFGDKALEVVRIFDEAISNAEYLNLSRIIRCILFLSEKDIGKLRKNIAVATYDPRDVMFWAEYINRDKSPVRIRDFNKPFDQASHDVRE